MIKFASHLHIHELYDATGQESFVLREGVHHLRSHLHALHRYRLVPLVDQLGRALILPRNETEKNSRLQIARETNLSFLSSSFSILSSRSLFVAIRSKHRFLLVIGLAGLRVPRDEAGALRRNPKACDAPRIDPAICEFTNEAALI